MMTILMIINTASRKGMPTLIVIETMLLDILILERSRNQSDKKF